MWAFVNKANVQMEDLIHDVNNADSTFTDVINYYGEEDKNISSAEFYGIFKTFVTSYRVHVLLIDIYTLTANQMKQKCQIDNQTAAGEKLAIEKRKQALEENKISRENARNAALPDPDSDVLDTLLEKLRSGDTVGRRVRRTRPSAEPRSIAPLALTLDESVGLGNTTVDRARDMLARLQSNGDVLAGLQSDGFVIPPSPTVAASQRRRRRRTENHNSGEMPGSPLTTEIHEIQEEEETPDTTQ